MERPLVDTDGDPIEYGFEVMLTPKEAATILCVGTRTLSHWADLGKIRCTRSAGGHRRYPADAVRAAVNGDWERAATKRPQNEMSPADVLVAVE